MIPLLAAFLLFNAYSVSACVCAGTPGVTEALNQSGAVFSGKLVSAEYQKGVSNEFKSIQEDMTGKKVDYEVLVLRFQVEQWWKGGSTAEVTLLTGQTRNPDASESISDCDYPFKVGKRYLVYASDSDGKLRSDACTRTQELKRAKADLKVLGEGRKPGEGI